MIEVATTPVSASTKNSAKKEPTPRLEYDQQSITLYWDEGLDRYLEAVLGKCSPADLEQGVLDLLKRLNMGDDEVEIIEEISPNMRLFDAPSCRIDELTLLTDIKMDKFHISLKSMLVPANMIERTSLYVMR